MPKSDTSFPVVRPATPTLRVLCSILVAASTETAGIHGSAATYHVPDDFGTIQAAIDAAAANDTILVAAGTYTENLDTRGTFLYLIGTSGAEATVVDAGLIGRALTLYPGGYVEGFTFRRGYTYGGAGIRISGSGPTTIQHNIITANIAGTADNGVGGGIYLDGAASDVQIRENTITHNYAGTSGGGIYDASGAPGVVISHNQITGNTSDLTGGGLRVQSALCSYNLIADNSAAYSAGGVFCEGGEISNNTIVHNTGYAPSANGAGVEARFGVVRNNIVASNSGRPGRMAGVGIWVAAVYPVALSCNDSWDNDGGPYAVSGQCDTTGQHNFSLDPLFCNAPEQVFNVASGSPCAPDNVTGCGLVGAFAIDASCVPTRTRRFTWGMLKRIYRQ